MDGWMGDAWRAASFLREFPQRVKCPTAEVLRSRNRRETRRRCGHEPLTAGPPRQRETWERLRASRYQVEDKKATMFWRWERVSGNSELTSEAVGETAAEDALPAQVGRGEEWIYRRNIESTLSYKLRLILQTLVIQLFTVLKMV